MDDLLSVQGGGLDWFREVVGDFHDRLSDFFFHRIVVHRGDEAIRSSRGWLREDPLVRPYRLLRPDSVPTRRDFVVGCPLSAAAVLSCTVQADRWIAPHLAVRALFDYERWSCCVTQPVRFSPLWPASWLPAIDKSRGSKSVEVRRVWEIYDDRLQFMSQRDAFLLRVWTLVMFLKLGWFGLVLLRLLLQMLIVFLVVLPLVKVWFLGVVWLVSGVFGLGLQGS